jgi:hypothetical protein
MLHQLLTVYYIVRNAEARVSSCVHLCCSVTVSQVAQVIYVRVFGDSHRWFLKEGNRVLRSGGNSLLQALHTKPEPHAMKLDNDELVLVGLSDDAIIDRIAKPASLAV